MPGKMLSSKNSNIKSGLKNQPTPTLDIEPFFLDDEVVSRIFHYQIRYGYTVKEVVDHL